MQVRTQASVTAGRESRRVGSQAESAEAAIQRPPLSGQATCTSSRPPHAWLVCAVSLILTRRAFCQAALLYTNTAGQRVIRVHTLALPVTDNISTVFKGADLDAQVGLFEKALLELVVGLPLIVGLGTT